MAQKEDPTEYEISLLQARLGISYEDAAKRLEGKGPGWSNRLQPEEIIFNPWDDENLDVDE
jgi:hypothetical protein